MISINKGDTVYYARNEIGTYRCVHLKVININEDMTYFTAVEVLGKRYGFTFLFDFEDLEQIVFTSRSDCVEYMEFMEGNNENNF